MGLILLALHTVIAAKPWRTAVIADHPPPALRWVPLLFCAPHFLCCLDGLRFLAALLGGAFLLVACVAVLGAIEIGVVVLDEGNATALAVTGCAHFVLPMCCERENAQHKEISC